MEKRTCFIIMPFSKAQGPQGTLDEKTLNFIYDHIIHKAVLECKQKSRTVFSEVSRYDSRIGSIISGITANLNSADLVIADLTGLNPNVMYELGVRHTLKRGTIIISQDISSIPSDLRDYMCVGYKYSNNTIEQQENYDEFKASLQKTVQELFTTEKFDSPVLSYLKGKEKYWHEDEIKKLKQNVRIGAYIFQNFEDLISIVDKIETEKATVALNIVNAVLGNLSAAISDLNLSIEDYTLYENIQIAKTTISEIQKKAIIVDYYGEVAKNINDEEAKKAFPSILNIDEKQFVNYFLLRRGKHELNSFKEVFSKKHHFYKIFMGEMENHLEKKCKEYKIKKGEIRKIIKG